MRQCNGSVISPFVVFFVTFVMISKVVSSHRTTLHYNKNTVIEQDSESDEFELDSSIFISRLLKTAPSALRLTEGHHNEFDVKNLSKAKSLASRSLDYSSDHHVHTPERVRDCSKLVSEIVMHPRDSVNKKDQYIFGRLARECRGPKACVDATTPEHKVYGCENDYILEVIETFSPDKQKIERQKVLIPNGCICGLRDA